MDYNSVGTLIGAMLLGLLPATIAHAKGRNFGVWWLYGTLLFVIALVHSLFLNEVKTCIACGQKINNKYKVCPFCGNHQSYVKSGIKN